MIQALRRYRPNKRRYLVLEDNDPSGYKSNKAKAAKEELKVDTIDFPPYSPDLNPLDYGLWDEVERRMTKQKIPSRESIAAYKKRLRRTAMAIPEKVIRRLLADMTVRTQMVFDEDGGHISKD